MILENLSAYPFTGWLSTSAVLTPEQVSAGGGTCDGQPFVVGKPMGLRGHKVDIFAVLPAGTVKDVPLVFGAPPRASSPAFGKLGQPKVMGIPMDFQDLQTTEGAWRAHLRARVAPMLVVDLRTYLSAGAFAPFTCRVTCSNVGIPDLTATIQPDFGLTCGDAVVQFLGGLERTQPPSLKGGFSTILPAGMQMGDGQSLTLVGTMFWPSLGATDAAAASAAAMSSGMVGAWDPAWQKNLGPLRSVADLPTRFSGRQWAVSNYPGALARLMSWNEGPLGITANSGQTGAEEEQPGLAKGAAVFAGGGWTAIQTLRFVAYGFGRVPCHQREADGRPISDLEHPDCMYWDGRAHKAMPDHLGKNPDEFGNWLTAGWWGPNDEHHFIGTVGSAYMLTGDEELQAILHERAIVWLMSDTVDSRMSTSGPRAARARGWASIVASWFWLCLEDRALAQRVRDRYVARLAMYTADFAAHGAIADARPNDVDGSGALIGLAAAVWSGPGPSPFPSFSMKYQNAIWAGGMQVAGETMDIPEARDTAYQVALGILESAFKQEGAGWVGWEVLGVRPDGSTLPPAEFVEGQGAHHSGLFDGGAWWALGLWTVLRHDPNNAKAQTIWRDWVARAKAGTAMLDWFLPMVTP